MHAPEGEVKYPFPNVGSPNSTARLLSFNAPANISLALAVPLFTLQGLRRHQFFSTINISITRAKSKVPDTRMITKKFVIRERATRGNKTH